MKEKVSFQGLAVPVASAVAIVYIYVFVLAYLANAETLIAGNIHDYFLPLNAAYVTGMSGLGQETLRSPFGPFYVLLSAASFGMIRAFPGWLSLDKIHALSSLQVSLFVIALFFLFRSLQRTERKLPLWLLAFSLMVCFQPREIRLDEILPDWYGTYNNHLWAVLLLQAANHYAWRGQRPGNKTVIALAVFEAACLSITFHYKVSFFAASAGLALLPLGSVGTLRGKLTYAGVTLAAFAVVAALLAAAGFSYARYFEDLRWAAAAKSPIPLQVAAQLIALAAFVFVAFMLQWERRHAFAASSAEARNLSGLAGLFRRSFSMIGFDAVAGVALALAALGDFRSPVWPYVVMALCAARVSGVAHSGANARALPVARLVRGVAVAWLILLMSVSLVSLCNIALFSAGKASPMPHANTLRRVIEADPLRFVFGQITLSPSLENLVATGLVAPGTGAPQTLFDLSYQLQAHDDHALGGVLSAIVDTGYVDSLNATAQWLRREGERSGQAGRLVIGSVSFANPYPVLTGNLFPAGSLHWMHLGTSLSIPQLDEALEPLTQADVVIVPALAYDWIPESRLRCGFYLWNLRKGGLFVPQAIAGMNIIFLRRGGHLSPGTSIVQQDRALIERICNDTLSEELPLG